MLWGGVVGPHVTIIHDALGMGPEDPLAPGTRASGIWWPSLEACSNLFIGPHFIGPLPLVLTSDGH